MKIRLGFVSNSSSSSFCIYGAELGRSFTDEENNERYIEYNGEKHKIEELEKIISRLKLNVEVYDWSDLPVYIGRSFKEINDEETGLQFKKRIKNDLRTLLKQEVGCSTYEECTYNS